jgi:glycerol uptake facilitator-like aquaporin
MAKRLAAECFGTFALVFAGTGAIVIDDVTGGGVSHVGIALTFGLIVLAMIYTLGDISGAHINPQSRLAFGRRGDSTRARYCLMSSANAQVRSWQALPCDCFFQLTSHLELLFPQVRHSNLSFSN